MKKLTSEPTHILQHSIFIGLIFTNQPNILMDSNVHPSLQSKYHQLIINTKLSLKIQYPCPYSRKIWNYRRAESDLIIPL